MLTKLSPLQDVYVVMDSCLRLILLTYCGCSMPLQRCLSSYLDCVTSVPLDLFVPAQPAYILGS
jgi:hypothetical protein